MALAVATIQTNFEAIFKTNLSSASVAIRNALGSATTSIIRADDLTKDTIPPLPCIAFRWQSGGGAREQPQRYYPFVYIYDGLQKYWTRINPLITLIETAFYEVDIITYCETDYRAVSGEITDNALGLRCKYIPFVVSTR